MAGAALDDAQSLLDVDELPGAADDGAAEAPDLAELQAAFEASEWATRTPAEVEVPFEMAVDGRVVRGRMDAVFGSDEDGWLVVDWKTGAPPDAARRPRAAAVQLAAYRLAWARLHGIADDRAAPRAGRVPLRPHRRDRRARATCSTPPACAPSSRRGADAG